MSTAFEVLSERGFVAQASDPGLAEWLAKNRVTAYAGFDPTADSLHLGHLVPIMGLAHLQRAGHRVLAVVGGATAMIGDPSGKSEERNLLTTEQIEQNVRGVKRQMEKLLDFSGANAATLLNNHDWIAPMSFIGWLRDVGKHFTVATMIAKDSVSRRLASESGISYTEFSYQTLQAYDFLHLFRVHGCQLQVGGNDQWGNVTAGIDLIHRAARGRAFGITFPLVTTSSGEKFGKTAGNAVWLDAEKTSPWDFYQYLVRQEDRDVLGYLKLYTFLPMERIRALEAAVAGRPEAREAQQTLALTLTAMVHGEATAKEMEHAASVLYKEDLKTLSKSTLAAVFASAPATEIPRGQLNAGLDVPALLTQTELVKSRGEARRLLDSGGVYVNNVRFAADAKLDASHLAADTFIVLRAGKKNYHLLRVV